MATPEEEHTRGAGKGNSMSRCVNTVILLGNCGKDPEIKYTASGKPVAKLSSTRTTRTARASGMSVRTRLPALRTLGHG
ncbi:MAG: hypothetical protein DMG69_06320 [Acidobacteria bacterium]|nr:MAG: hypothetical protein DMG69_06320 [Acidobacteriota bacterium]